MTKSPSILNTVLLCLGFLQLSEWGSAARHFGAKPNGKILVVGATGSTGFRAVQGLLDVGYKPRDICLLTRNAKNPKATALKKAGFGIVEADLEDLTSLQEKQITKGCVGCYVHSTSSDTPELDKGEVGRAQNLASVIGTENSKIRQVVYNSAAAHENHRVKRIQQKHDVEEVFQDLVQDCNAKYSGNRTQRRLAFTSLRANIFMEELWKHYTRPQILDGVYPLPVRHSRKVYLVSVRDMGRLAGRIFLDDNTNIEPGSEDQSRTINVAGDYLSAQDVAEAFAAAQGAPCHHHNPRMMTFKSYFYFPELYEQIVFLQTFAVATDVEELITQFPDTMTSFAQFLKETHWEDREKSYADFSDIKLLRS